MISRWILPSRSAVSFSPEPILSSGGVIELPGYLAALT
jgi:hypothetical protein